MIIAEVNAQIREKLQEIGKLIIGWKICKMQDFIGILRCFKCYKYYHIAKDCTKKKRAEIVQNSIQQKNIEVK